MSFICPIQPSKSDFFTTTDEFAFCEKIVLPQALERLIRHWLMQINAKSCFLQLCWDAVFYNRFCHSTLKYFYTYLLNNLLSTTQNMNTIFARNFYQQKPLSFLSIEPQAINWLIQTVQFLKCCCYKATNLSIRPSSSLGIGWKRAWHESRIFSCSTSRIWMLRWLAKKR
jgi:hypothetical protein